MARLLHSSLELLNKPTNGSSVSLNLSLNLYLADKQNVVVIHCNSGKGRTGTAICSIMLYMGFFNNVDDCLRFFGHQRFTCGKGVSQPCQLRYLYYFEAFYRHKMKSPSVKRLRGI